MRLAQLSNVGNILLGVLAAKQPPVQDSARK